MRTTITIADELYRQAKAAAARRGRSVSQLIEDAVRVELLPAAPDRSVPDLVVFGGSGTLPGVDLHDGAALADLLDRGVGVDALR